MTLKQATKNLLYRNPSKPLYWLVLGLLFKGIPFLIVILNHPYNEIAGFWGATQGDTSSYLAPVNNLLLHGSYMPDFRMPGYGAIYLAFRLVLNPVASCNCMIIVQWLLSGISVYYLALTARSIFKSDRIFYLTFYLYLVCTFSNFFDAYLCTESLCSSILIFSAHSLVKSITSNKQPYLLFAGFLFAVTAFLRPVFAGVILIIPILILLSNSTKKLKACLVFAMPFILLDGAWICRNYRVHKSFTPLTSTGAFYPNSSSSYLQPLFEFTQSWGGACKFNETPPDLNWFNYYYPGMKPIKTHDSLPEYIYTTAFNKDSLLLMRSMITALRNQGVDTLTKIAYQAHLRSSLNLYHRSFERENSFIYFIKAPLKIMGVFLYGPTTREFLERGMNVPILGRTIVIFNTILYFIILTEGIIGIGLIMKSRNRLNPIFWVIPLLPMYIILIHPFIFRFFDSRFLMPIWSFMIICTSYTIAKFFKPTFDE